MRTRLTGKLGIKYPIVQGAMQWLSKAPLCAAVSKAGGLGMLTAKSFQDPEDLRSEIALVRKATDRPFGVNISMLPKHGADAPPEPYFKVCVQEEVPVVETAGRKPDEFVDMLKKRGIFMMHKVPAVRYALSAQSSGVDAVTLVGNECGGHPGRDQVSTLVTLAKARRELKIPFLAGGGIGDGYALAAALALGADGVVMGTRYLLSEEAGLGPALRQRLEQATELDSTLVLASLGNPLRALKNQTARECLELEQTGAGLAVLRPLISGLRGLKALQDDDPEGGLLAMGQCVGSMDQVLPAGQITARVVAEAKEAMNRLGAVMK